LGAGVAFVEGLGLEAIQAHARQLTAYFHDALNSIPGAQIRSPLDPHEATGITTFALANMEGVKVSTALRERWNILQRAALWGSSVRISLAAFIEQSDVDLLVEKIRILAAE
jgi:cysteine desulfurase/selenocysteine lyase